MANSAMTWARRSADCIRSADGYLVTKTRDAGLTIYSAWEPGPSLLDSQYADDGERAKTICQQHRSSQQKGVGDAQQHR